MGVFGSTFGEVFAQKGSTLNPLPPSGALTFEGETDLLTFEGETDILTFETI